MTETISRRLLISRRRLLGSGAAASVLAAAGLGAAAQPVRGGALRLAVPPGWMFDRLLAPGSLFDCLTEIDKDGGLRGELALGWTARDAGRDWTFELRPDAVFHDGRKVGEVDVVASLRPHQDGILGNAFSIRQGGPRQVRIQLREPDPQFPMILARGELAIRPCGMTGGRIGSGAYRLVEAGPGDRVRLARDPGWLRDTGRAWFDRVEILGLADAADRNDALVAGRVDAAFAPAAGRGAEIRRNRRLTLSTTEVAAPDGPRLLVIGHTTRLCGFDGPDPFRIAERGYFA